MSNVWKRFIHDDPVHERMLEKFFDLPNLPHFAKSRTDIKVDLFKNHPASEFYMLVDEAGDMIGSCGFFVTIDDNGITYCKTPYRLHVSDKGRGSYTNNDWEAVSIDWISRWGSSGIPMMTTVNLGNEKIAYYLIKNSKKFCDTLGPNDIFVLKQKEYYMHPKLVYEMNTWQYCWYTTDYIGFNREEKELPIDFVKTIEELWSKGYWLGSQGRNKVV